MFNPLMFFPTSCLSTSNIYYLSLSCLSTPPTSCLWSLCLFSPSYSVYVTGLITATLLSVDLYSLGASIFWCWFGFPRAHLVINILTKIAVCPVRWLHHCNHQDQFISFWGCWVEKTGIAELFIKLSVSWPGSSAQRGFFYLKLLLRFWREHTSKTGN